MLHFCRLYIVYVLKDRVECPDMLPLHYPHLHTVDGSPISEPRIQSRKGVMEKILKEGEEMGSSAKDNGSLCHACPPCCAVDTVLLPTLDNLDIDASRQASSMQTACIAIAQLSPWQCHHVSQRDLSTGCALNKLTVIELRGSSQSMFNIHFVQYNILDSNWCIYCYELGSQSAYSGYFGEKQKSSSVYLEIRKKWQLSPWVYISLIDKLRFEHFLGSWLLTIIYGGLARNREARPQI